MEYNHISVNKLNHAKKTITLTHYVMECFLFASSFIFTHSPKERGVTEVIAAHTYCHKLAIILPGSNV